MKLVNEPLGTAASHRACFPHIEHDPTSLLESTEVWPLTSVGEG